MNSRLKRIIARRVDPVVRDAQANRTARNRRRNKLAKASRKRAR